MDDEMREVVDEFLVESHENLDQMDRDFVTLERTPGDLEVLASVFRTIHTIKGTAGFLAFGKLEGLTHVGESLLSRLRDGDLQLTDEITSGLLALVDAVRAMLSVIEATGEDGDNDHAELIARLTALNTGTAQPTTTAAEPAAVVVVETVAEPAAEQQRVGEIFVEQQVATPSEVEYALRQQESGDPLHVGEILVEKGAVQPHQIREALDVQQEQREQKEASTPQSSVADNSIRVDVSLLDKLMNLVGELVLARNQIIQHTASSGDTSLVATTQHLNLVTTELQEGVMKTRMQPIGNVWNKFPRVVRDLAKGCGKQVRLEMDGKDTDLDKSILEAIKDPLTHLVRNSVDHGIETPEARIAAGKMAEGVVTLRAFHEGGLVNIEISDDGAGIDIERVRAKAVEKGVVSAERAAQMADREVANLIFMPGFSTAAKVTNVSGRGVGMDVVNTKYLDRPIFAGNVATTQAYDQNGAFLGDTNAVTRNVGPGVTVQVNVTGPQAFGPPGADLFATLTNLANDLRTNPSAVNTTDLAAIDVAASRVRNALGEVGARSAQLASTKARSDDLLLNLRDSLSKIEDIDLPKAATDLQIQQVSYQAALAATARVIQPSLVDFLR